MNHSYVQLFPTRSPPSVDIRAFAADVPVDPTFLVDTYDLAAGTRAAIRVIHDLGPAAHSAVRVDSGDLNAGARLVRNLLDEAHLPRVRIVVSGGLDEYRITALRHRQAPIDVFAVGTAVGVGADAPSLDSAYKLVQIDDRPVCKLSVGKATAPGQKQVWLQRAGALQDVLSLRDEQPPAGCEPLLEPFMIDGHRLAAREPLPDATARLTGLTELVGMRWARNVGVTRGNGRAGVGWSCCTSRCDIAGEDEAKPVVGDLSVGFAGSEPESRSASRVRTAS